MRGRQTAGGVFVTPRGFTMMAAGTEYILQRLICGEGEGMPQSSLFNEKMRTVGKNNRQVKRQKPRAKD